MPQPMHMQLFPDQMIQGCHQKHCLLLIGFRQDDFLVQVILGWIIEDVFIDLGCEFLLKEFGEGLLWGEKLVVKTKLQLLLNLMFYLIQ